jgi:salicylate hydroxylase
MRLAGLDIAVIGAGIAGLATATALAQRRARVQVFEQAAALGEVGAGIQVAPNGVAVLAALGLGDAAAGRASLPQEVELVDFRRGRAVARLPLGRTVLARHGLPYWHLHRADLLAVLATGAAEAGATLTLGVAVSAVAHEGAGLRVRTAGGDVGPFAVVVAADGVRSSLRTARLDPAAARFTGRVAWRALVPASRAPAAFLRPAARVTMAPGRHLVSYPLRGGTLVNLVAIEERRAWAEEGWSLRDDPANLRRAFAGWDGPAADLIAAVEDCWLWGLFDHAPLRAWIDGRLALIGDACHPMLPFLAQGATMALEDAWVLADRLDRAADPGLGLAAYQAARLPRATRVQRAAARAGRIYHLRGGLREPVQAALGAVSHFAPGLIARRFDWLYGYDVTATG